jgi:hypothetical protein
MFFTANSLKFTSNNSGIDRNGGCRRRRLVIEIKRFYPNPDLFGKIKRAD